MSAWVVIPCLTALRAEFNALAPARDKGSDGTIGDQNHTSSSDHTPDEDSDKLRSKDADSVNEVHALDIDSTGPWPDGRTFRQIFLDVIAGEKKKWLSATDKCRLHYAIYDRQIYDKDNDFNPVVYTGTDPHTGHAHFSARYETSCENDTRPWGVVPPRSTLESPEMTEQQMVDRLVKELSDPSSALATNMKRIGWQYVGGGIPEGMSTLAVLNELLTTQRAVVDKLQQVLDAVTAPPAPVG